jgi:hypothetical protein
MKKAAPGEFFQSTRARLMAGAAQRTGFLRKLSPGSRWGTDGSQTLRWRKKDSNPWSPCQGELSWRWAVG